MKPRPPFQMFNTRRGRFVAAAAALLGVAAPLTAQGGGRRQDVVGTYLSTIVDEKGQALSRAILTFHHGGTMQSIDSNQAGIPEVFHPFTENAGQWEQAGHGEIRASAISFTLPGSEGGEQQLARNDFRARIDRRTGMIEGTVELIFFPLAADPNRDIGESLGVFRWTALPLQLRGR